MFNPFLSIVRLSFFDSQVRRFSYGVVLGLGFSMSVILSTFGIMDGFDRQLKNRLRSLNGDVVLIKKQGQFSPQELKNSLSDFGEDIEVGITLETESFVIIDGIAKGVLLQGIFSTNQEASFLSLGQELSSLYSIGAGDNIVLALPNGANGIDGLPALFKKEVTGIIDYGLYEKNLRLIQVDYAWLSKELNLHDLANKATIRFKEMPENVDSIEYVTSKIPKIKAMLGSDFAIRPYWAEFSTLIEAVQIEKFVVSGILQLIVIISVFNALAFILFINEKKIQEVFLLRAVGMTKSYLRKSWFGLIFILWSVGCLLSLPFTYFFKFMLKNLDVLKLPGDIYHMARIELEIDFWGHVIVFGASLFWLVLVGIYILRKTNKGSIISGLRREFA